MIVPKAINGANGIGWFLSLVKRRMYISAIALEMVIDVSKGWIGKTRPITK